MNLQNKAPGRVNNKRSASNAGLPDMSPPGPSPTSPGFADQSSGNMGGDNGRHLSDLHMAAATASRLDSNGDDSDEDQLHISDEHLHNVSMPLKGSQIGGRKSGSKNYSSSEHKHFLFLVDRLQAWAEGPTGESWSEIAQRQHKKLGYRRDHMVLHDHFMEMVNITRTLMRENALLFPGLPEDPNVTDELLSEHMEMAFLELGEQLFLAFQNRAGKRLCPAAWWDADIFANVARISSEMETSSGGIQDHALMEQRRKEIDYEEKASESSIMQTRTHVEGRRSISNVSSAVAPLSPSGGPASSLKDDLQEIKQSSKMLRKFDDRLNKVEDKIDMILKHLGVPNN